MWENTLSTTNYSFNGPALLALARDVGSAFVGSPTMYGGAATPNNKTVWHGTRVYNNTGKQNSIPIQNRTERPKYAGHRELGYLVFSVQILCLSSLSCDMFFIVPKKNRTLWAYTNTSHQQKAFYQAGLKKALGARLLVFS